MKNATGLPTKIERREKDQGPDNNLDFFSETSVLLDCVLLCPEVFSCIIVAHPATSFRVASAVVTLNVERCHKLTKLTGGFEPG